VDGAACRERNGIGEAGRLDGAVIGQGPGLSRCGYLSRHGHAGRDVNRVAAFGVKVDGAPIRGDFNIGSDDRTAGGGNGKASDQHPNRRAAALRDNHASISASRGGTRGPRPMRNRTDSRTNRADASVGTAAGGVAFRGIPVASRVMTTDQTDSPKNHRLNSWKEIAAFFGKDERTVKRWESQRGLPVHRLPGGTRATVFAFTAELDQWLRSGRPTAGTSASSGDPPGVFPIVDRPRRHSLRLAALGVVAIVAIAALTLSLSRQTDTMAGAPFAGSVSPIAAHQPPPEARDLYLKGVYHWNTRSPDGLQQAVDLFNEAIARDPLYAEAYVGLANSYNLLSQYTVLPADDAYPLAMAAAERALELNDGLADAHAALAFTTFYWSRDIDRAQDLFERSLSLDPSSARTHHWYALVMMHSGLMDAPVRAITRAQELDPEARSILANKGLIYFYAGRTDEAVTLLEELRRSAPDFQPPHFYLATVYLDQERFEDYLAASGTAAELSGNAALQRE
jgi:hypothetical protein